MDRMVREQDNSKTANESRARRSSIARSTLTDLSRLLARQAAREFLENVGTDEADHKFVDETRT